MKLDEAIKDIKEKRDHYEYMANEYRDSEPDMHQRYAADYENCAQLYEWLKELKVYREDKCHDNTTAERGGGQYEGI